MQTSSCLQASTAFTWRCISAAPARHSAARQAQNISHQWQALRAARCQPWQGQQAKVPKSAILPKANLGRCRIGHQVSRHGTADHRLAALAYQHCPAQPRWRRRTRSAPALARPREAASRFQAADGLGPHAPVPGLPGLQQETALSAGHASSSALVRGKMAQWLRCHESRAASWCIVPTGHVARRQAAR